MTTMSKKKHERISDDTELRRYGVGQHDNVDRDQNTNLTCIVHYYIIFTWLYHEILK